MQSNAKQCKAMQSKAQRWWRRTKPWPRSSHALDGGSNSGPARCDTWTASRIASASFSSGAQLSGKAAKAHFSSQLLIHLRVHRRKEVILLDSCLQAPVIIELDSAFWNSSTKLALRSLPRSLFTRVSSRMLQNAHIDSALMLPASIIFKADDNDPLQRILASEEKDILSRDSQAKGCGSLI